MLVTAALLTIQSCHHNARYDSGDGARKLTKQRVIWVKPVSMLSDIAQTGSIDASIIVQTDSETSAVRDWKYR